MLSRLAATSVSASATRSSCLCSLRRLYSSSLNGNRSPVDNVMRQDPAFHQEDATTQTQAAYELKVPGVIGQGVEANIAKPGTVDFPNPSEQLLQKVNVETVTTDGDVASADGADSMPR